MVRKGGRKSNPPRESGRNLYKVRLVGGRVKKRKRRMETLVTAKNSSSNSPLQGVAGKKKGRFDIWEGIGRKGGQKGTAVSLKKRIEKKNKRLTAKPVAKGRFWTKKN